MSHIYVTKSSSKVGYSENRINIVNEDGVKQSFPVETVESIAIFGRPEISSACISNALIRGITIAFFSSQGRYFGRLTSTQHTDTFKQRKQMELTGNDMYCRQFSKLIIRAKIHNQLVIMKRYARSGNSNIREEVIQIQNAEKKIDLSGTIPEIMGYEGIAARYYYQGLGKIVDSNFRFNKRTRRPPKDPFNSLLSLGYSLLMNIVFGSIERKGLNPYFGFLHSDKLKHPALASDLMEEWRAVIVDAVAMSLVNGHEISIDDFYRNDTQGGTFLHDSGFKKFIKKFERKLLTDNNYLNYLDYSVSFRTAIDHQVNKVSNAIEKNDFEVYEPIILR